MNNTEKFNKLRRLFKEYEALIANKNGTIDEIQKLRVPGGIRENCVKEYKGFVDPRIEKIANEIMEIVNLDPNSDPDDILRFYDACLDGEQMIKRGDVEEAIKICRCGPCNLRICPLCDVRGCTRITRMYREGKYDRMVRIKED